MPATTAFYVLHDGYSGSNRNVIRVDGNAMNGVIGQRTMHATYVADVTRNNYNLPVLRCWCCPVAA